MNAEPSSATSSPSGSGPTAAQRKERGAIAAQVSLDEFPHPRRRSRDQCVAVAQSNEGHLPCPCLAHGDTHSARAVDAGKLRELTIMTRHVKHAELGSRGVTRNARHAGRVKNLTPRVFIENRNQQSKYAEAPSLGGRRPAA